ncbi:MAG: hypothetical protein ACOVMQ_01800 [Cyclobacteriaceae bacterium]|jgi:hypothetical protein
MRKFRIIFLLSVGLLFICDRSLSYLFDYFYQHTKTGQSGGKINYYLSLEKTPEWVVMGNSRALYQIIPDSFPATTYNLCHAGMHQIFQTGLLTQMANEGKMPKLILLHIEPEEFIGEQFNRDIQNLKYYHSKNEWITNELNALSPYEPTKFFFASYRYNGRVISLMKNYLQTRRTDYNSNGYMVIEPSETDSITTMYSLQQAQPPSNEKLNLQQWNYLRAFIDRCQKEKTQVICFTSPVYSYSYRATAGVLELEKNLEKMGVPYINYLQKNIPALQQRASFWKDRHHLNHAGAQIESSVLQHDVDSLLRQPL